MDPNVISWMRNIYLNSNIQKNKLRDNKNRYFATMTPTVKEILPALLFIINSVFKILPA
jgi:hypothetical protein